MSQNVLLSGLSRQDLRQHFRQLRKQLAHKEQHEAAQQLLPQCLASGILDNAQKVALYLPNDGEIDPIFIREYCWQQGVEIYLPVIHPFSAGYLLFTRYHSNSLMLPNRFGIPEPQISVQDICPVSELDCIMTPLVAFDSSGNRLGMGGGFYDRTLAPVERDNLPIKIAGLAHNCQESTLLPIQSWDIPLQKIITPGRVICSISEL